MRVRQTVGVLLTSDAGAKQLPCDFGALHNTRKEVLLVLVKIDFNNRKHSIDDNNNNSSSSSSSNSSSNFHRSTTGSSTSSNRNKQ